MRSPVGALVVILLVVAGVGIGLAVVLAGANMITAFVGIASMLVAGVGIVSAPWLAPRSSRGAVACTVVSLASVLLAAILLLPSPPSNSNLWVPINLGRFGGLVVAQLGLAFSVHAGVVRSLTPVRALVLIAANLLAVIIGLAFAGWESRS